MESYETLLATLALTMGASWASGINLYAALLVLGIGGSTGNVDLPPDLQVLADPMVIGAAALMYFIEFFVDKTPGLDTGWDALHTFIRIPAGAMLAAGAVGDVTPVLEIAAGIMGGSMAAVSHATKAGSRALINTSPEPFTNWGASLTEDVVVIGGLWTALAHPLVFLCLLALFLVVAIWLLPKMWRLIKVILLKIGRFLGLAKTPPETPPQGAGSSTSVNAKPDRAKQLEALGVLHQSGHLNDDDASQARGKILDN